MAATDPWLDLRGRELTGDALLERWERLQSSVATGAENDDNDDALSEHALMSDVDDSSAAIPLDVRSPRPSIRVTQMVDVRPLYLPAGRRRRRTVQAPNTFTWKDAVDGRRRPM
jgi:hypothetical protein